MTQSNLLELAQQGDPQAIAALMNQSLQPKGMTAIVERMGDCLSVLLEADQVPNRQTLTAFVHRGISNLGIESIRSVKVLGQQTGTNLPVWTQDLTLEPPTTAAEAIDAVDLSPPVDSMVDLSPTDDEELEALWIAPSEEQSQDSLADLLAEESTDDLQSLFDDQPEELEAGTGSDNPLEDLRSMFGEQSETDFPPLEESSFNGADLNSEAKPRSLQDLFGEDPDTEDPLSQLDGMFNEPTFTESNLGLGNDLDSELDDDLSDDLGLESSDSDSLADLFGDRPSQENLGMFEEIPPDEEEFQDLFGETNSGISSEEETFEGLLEQPSPEAIAPETWMLLNKELPSHPTEDSEADNSLMDLLSEDPSGVSSVVSEEQSVDDPSGGTATDPLLGFSDEEELILDLSFMEESSPAETLLGDLDEEDSLLDFLDQQESEQSEDPLSKRFAGADAEPSEPLSEPLLFNELDDEDDLGTLDNLEAIDEPLLFDNLSDEPISFDRVESLSDEPLLFDEPDQELGTLDNLEAIDEPLLFDDLSDEPLSFDRVESSVDEALLFDEPLILDEPLDQPMSFDNLEWIDETPSFSEPEPSLTDISSQGKSFQEQQALADFFADDPLADFLSLPVQPPGEEFLEGGLSEPMAAATAQGYFNSPEPSLAFQPDRANSVPSFQSELENDQDFLNQTFQSPQPNDLFSERMDSLEADFPQDFQVDSLDQPDRDFLGNDDMPPADNWDGALENPLPDVDLNQAHPTSSLESLTDDSDLPNLPTEALFGEPSGDRHPEAESNILHETHDRWDLDADDEPTAIEYPLSSTVGAFRGGLAGADLLEDLTISLPNLPEEVYEQQVAYPSLNDPTQAPPQPKSSPWIFPLVLFGLTGWILALIGLSYFLKDRDPTQAPIVQPSTGTPAPTVPPAPASPSSALPSSEDSAALPKNLDWMAVD